MAKLTGREAYGEELLAEMQQRYRSATLSAPTTSAPRGVYYEPTGYTAGERTLKGELMRMAGWRNVATEARARLICGFGCP